MNVRGFARVISGPYSGPRPGPTWHVSFIADAMTNRASSILSSHTSPAIERLARVGFAAKGVVYIIVGWLAAQAAFGEGGETTGSKGALHSLLEKPFGRFMLAIIALGLIGYAIWRIIDAVSDPRGRGKDGKGVALRLMSAAKGLVYGGLAISAARLAMHRGSASSGDNAEARSASSALMDKPMGWALVTIVGLGILGYGVYQLVSAWKSKLSEDLDLGSIAPAQRSALIATSRFGIAARGVVFIMMGYFFARAGLDGRSSQARGVGGVLDSIAEFGKYPLALIAVGLIAYGIYELLNSRYRRIRVA